ncbi:MAG: hypothetical protein M0Z75_16580 [Nitrospiraceae bacterium]|nr:hypothetical protein [Nitrospiraceae bacterium]
MKKLLWPLPLIVFFLASGTVFAQHGDGIKKRRPLPEEYGTIIINNYSEYNGLAAVVYPHWLHRSIYTCRLCHVDVGFAMKAGGTGITARDNEKGFYCGTCHNGKMLFRGKPVFKACEPSRSTRGWISAQEAGRCDKCHSDGKQPDQDYDFYSFTAGFPKERFGNGIDWEKAEAEGKIHLIDFINGVSARRPDFPIPSDDAIIPKIKGMPKVIFSHKKHMDWSGCELCHPEIFSIEKGGDEMSMTDNFNGEYCGACHGKVAFPLIECDRCHQSTSQ